MDDALRADTLALAVEAEVQDLLIGVLAAGFLAGNAAQEQGVVVGCCHSGMGVVAHGLPLVGLLLGAVGRQLAPLRLSNSLCTFVGLPRFCVGLGGGLGSGYEFFELSDAFGVEGGAFVADFADDTLSGG